MKTLQEQETQVILSMAEALKALEQQLADAMTLHVQHHDRRNRDIANVA